MDGFQELVQKWWTEPTPVGCGAFVVSKRISFLKNNLRKWAKFSFGSLILKKLSFLHDLEELNTFKESRKLTSSETKRELEIHEQLGTILKQEEIYLKQ